MARKNRIDVAIVGGGLSGVLVAVRLVAARPDLEIVVFEKDCTLGGRHTWSFHETDVAPSSRAWLDAFVAHRWPRQQVIFPTHTRRLDTPYCSIDSNRLHAVATARLGHRVRLGVEVAALSADGVTLAGGEFVAAGAVVDARGDVRSPHVALGFQKFLGQEIVFAAPHGLDAPVIMDATPPQEDGYRFLYVLPFTDRSALVEDTRYADGAGLAREALRRGIAAYCAGRGWTIAEIVREEEGVLPIALAGDIDAFLADGPAGVARVGMRAALFHPLTGYSLPDAVGLAETMATAPDHSGQALAALTRAHAAAAWKGRGFYRLLARMLFGAAEPGERYKVLQRFYRLPQPLIERFYAGATPLRDQARLLVGRPPVPIGRAVRCVDEAAFMRRSARRTAEA